nr:hypothetical protein [Paludibacteraceae bacterium]
VDNWLKKVKGYNAKTATRTSKFIWGLLTAINGEEVEINDFINLNEKAYISSIKNVAYLNLRVDENIGTSTKAEYGKIREQFNETKGYLKDQIEKLNPQIIIISSKLGCELFNTCFNDCNLYYQTVKKWDYKVVCSIKHFSRSSNKEFYDSISKIVSIFND